MQFHDCLNLTRGRTSVLEHEAMIDEHVKLWFQKLQAKHGKGDICDFSIWIDT